MRGKLLREKKYLQQLLVGKSGGVFEGQRACRAWGMEENRRLWYDIASDRCGHACVILHVTLIHLNMI